MTLTEFLLARIAEDEAGIPTGPPSPWMYATHPAYSGDRDWSMSEHHVRYVATGANYQCRVADTWHEDVARHLARHADPARVRLECDAKRRIVEVHEHRAQHDYGNGGDWSRATLEILALPYAGHPDYREEWKP